MSERAATRGRVLVADDDPVTRRLLEHHLAEAGYEPVLAADGAEAIDRLGPEIRVALFDLQMPERSGLECLEEARRRLPDLPVLVISQVGGVRDAVLAMKQGAYEYISKPIDPEELLTRIEQAERSSRLASENRQLRQAVGSPMVSASLVGSGDNSQSLRERIERLAALDSTVLLTGESGTGKTTLARLIHQLGPRSDKPFVAVSCVSLPRDLIEAELFGHARGAFTGAVADRPGRAEVAHGGTLFLDEIGDMPMEIQPKLLTFLQDRTLQRIGETRPRSVDVRVIAATNRDLKQRVGRGEFREDLFFRIAVLPVHVPPLRERAEDIDAFADHLLAKIAGKRGVAAYELTDGARRALRAYAWPGNVRELENVLERATAFSRDGRIESAELGLIDASAADPSPADDPAMAAGSLAGRTLAEIERQAIRDHLEAAGGNKRAAARSLGIDEKSIYNKMKRFGMR